MRVTIDIDTRAICRVLMYDKRKIRVVLDEIGAMVNRITDAFEELNQKSASREAEAALSTVSQIIKEPVAPVQQSEQDKKNKTDKIKPENDKKSQKREIKSQDQEIKPVKKEWNEEQKKDIALIKQAYQAKRSAKNNTRKRTDIDDSLIVYMRDEQHRTIKQIANEIKCAPQTVLNRYNKAKIKAEKGGDKK